jgi:hypothetical protein
LRDDSNLAAFALAQDERDFYSSLTADLNLLIHWLYSGQALGRVEVIKINYVEEKRVAI